MFHLRTQMVAPVSVQEAFEAFEDPRNLARITPPWLRFRIVTPEPIAMKKDAVFDYTIRWMGAPLAWRTRITEYEPPFLFVDEQTRGPYAFWRHRHTFHPSEEGTLVSDDVDYVLPFGWLGRAAQPLVGRQLKEIFRFRQAALNEMMCQGRGRWTDPVISEKRS